MTAETIAALIQVGAAGAVIIVVMAFLNYLEKRDKAITEILSNIQSSSTTVSSKLDTTNYKLDCMADDTTKTRDDISGVKRDLEVVKAIITNPPTKRREMT